MTTIVMIFPKINWPKNTERHHQVVEWQLYVVERQFQVVKRQTQVAERRSGPFRLNLTTVLRKS